MATTPKVGVLGAGFSCLEIPFYRRYSLGDRIDLTRVAKLIVE